MKKKMEFVDSRQIQNVLNSLKNEVCSFANSNEKVKEFEFRTIPFNKYPNKILKNTNLK